MDPGSTKSPCRCAYFSPGMELFYTKTLDQYRHEIQTNTNYNILLEDWSKLCVSHFNYGIYHGLVVIHHNLQATTTPSRMVPTWFRFTCLWMLARERVGGAWLVAGPMTFFHQPDLAGQGRPTLPRQPFLVWPSGTGKGLAAWRSHMYDGTLFPNEHTSTLVNHPTIKFRVYIHPWHL